jgi:transposase
LWVRVIRTGGGYGWGMRYADSGGLTAKERVGRERVRLAAARMFVDGASNGQVAEGLRVSVMSVSRWRRAFDAGGMDALASKGPGGARCKLTDAQLQELEAQLDAGPAAHGFAEDQCWTQARIAEVIAIMFGVEYTPAGVGYLLHRMGFSVQVPARRAAERDEDAIGAWKGEQWPAIKGWRRTWGRGCVSRTRPVRV